MPISTAPYTYLQETLPDGTALELVPVSGGSFEMGSNDGHSDEKPVQTITVSDFYLGKYPITTAQYLSFVKATDTNPPEWMTPGSDYNLDTGSDKHYERHIGLNRPVVGVSWNQAVAYCEWLSAVSAACTVRPVYSTSSTKMTVLASNPLDPCTVMTRTKPLVLLSSRLISVGAADIQPRKRSAMADGRRPSRGISMKRILILTGTAKPQLLLST